MRIKVKKNWTNLIYDILMICMLLDASYANIYSNTFISPNSKKLKNMEHLLDKTIVTSTQLKTIPSENPSSSSIIISASSSLSTEENIYNNNNNDNIIKRRSADPILSQTTTTSADHFDLFKNIEDTLESNDVELFGRIGHYIQPSKTDKNYYSDTVETTIDPMSGEVRGALQGRSLHEPQEMIMPTATPIMMTTTTTDFVTLSTNYGKPRQANPDIQGIITGIVKILEGNVNVHANTAIEMGRPVRPLSTRINNRGPPRLTDLPPLPPDFNLPALPKLPPQSVHPSSTRSPSPYPFELPPLANMSPKRPPSFHNDGNLPPVFYRPVTVPPPWNRRPRPSKRPYIPPYKPLSAMGGNTDMVSLTSEKPNGDIFTLNFEPHLSGPHSEEEVDGENEEKLPEIEETNDTPEQVTTAEITTEPQQTLSHPDVMDKETADFEKNKEKNPKPDKTTKITLVTPTIKTDILETNISLVTEEPTSLDTTTSIMPTTMVQASSSSSTLNGTIAQHNDSESSGSGISEVHDNVIPMLESSIQEIVSTTHVDHHPTPTSSISSTTSSTITSFTKSSSTSITSNTDTLATIALPSPLPSFPWNIGELNISETKRPGIVLDGSEDKPESINRQQIITRYPVEDTIDVTVTVVQGQGGSSMGQGQAHVIPVDLDNVNSPTDILTSPVGSQGYVSIDGKRTHFNLFPDSSETVGIKPSKPIPNQFVQGTGYIEHEVPNKSGLAPSKPVGPRRPPYSRPKPSHPPVRIDTCIVGDDSTCDVSQHEICRTELGISACHCRPGTARRKHRDPCRKIVSVLVSLRVDRVYERRVVWANELLEKSSDSFEQLSFEAERAVESAMSMTPFSDEYLGAKVNNIYKGDATRGQPGVFVNITLQLEENAETSRPTVRADIQKHLLGVIQRRNNNVGNSALWVDSPPGSVSSLQDLDECSSPDLHDCHSQAKCINIFGSFKCECMDGLRDPWFDNKHRAGRHCEQCPATRCNNRGECKYHNGQEVCMCSGNYYGNQCELDGEVLGVAIGASVAAIIIIGLTLVFLVMWSRRWNREQKAAVGSPVFGYMATANNTVKAPVVGATPYQLTLEDRLRWAQIADVMAQANHYAPEPGMAPARPSSAMFGYPTLPMGGTVQRHPGSVCGSRAGGGTMPPIPLPRLNLQAQLANRAASLQGMKPLDNSSSSEEEDKIDLLGRNFYVPRPKSRSNASIANQSGIYYDVDYDQNEVYKPSGIPLKYLTGLNGQTTEQKDNDFSYYDDFNIERKQFNCSPTTSL